MTLPPRTRVRVTAHALERWQQRLGRASDTAADVERALRGAALVRVGGPCGAGTDLAEFSADGLTFGVEWNRYHRVVLVRTVLVNPSRLYRGRRKG